MIQLLLWLPLAGGLLACLMPQRLVPVPPLVVGGLRIALAIGVVVHFDPTGGLQHTVDESWIPDLGVRYQLGIDGISLFLAVLTSIVWLGSTIWSTINRPERSRTYFLMLGLGETATLGAFLAQDLILFVLFFDLMLVPFFFLFGGWGSEHPGGEGEGPIRPQAATVKMIVYTLIGSLLMLVGAIATGILAADGGDVTFSMSELAENPLGQGSQDWIFWCFAAAFLVKMPAFPLHGWMPDAYRVAPIQNLAIFSAVLSKVGAYGFLRVVLPIFPDATTRFQEVLLLIAVASILYGSVMAFTQSSARLVGGYSSVAQLGFITLGIFALRPDGADGAVLQMVAHGLVIAPLFLIVYVLAARTGGDDIRRMGGLAMRAPVLAALFLIVTMAWLAMPGSANFIGEFYILNGIFQAKIVFAFLAAAAVAMAAYYALRVFQHAMHNRKPDGIVSRELPLGEGAVVVVLVALVLALSLYPGFVLERTDDAVNTTLSEAFGPQATEVARR